MLTGQRPSCHSMGHRKTYLGGHLGTEEPDKGTASGNVGDRRDLRKSPIIKLVEQQSWFDAEAYRMNN